MVTGRGKLSNYRCIRRSRGQRLGDRGGDVSGAAWVRGQLVESSHALGLWDESLSRAEAYAAERAASGQRMYLAVRHPQDAAWAIGLGFAMSAFALDDADRLRECLDASPHPEWAAVVRACLDREYARAADLLIPGGGRRYEAAARFRAAEVALEVGRRAEAEEQMGRALAFYREVGGTFWIERGEALLARTQ